MTSDDTLLPRRRLARVQQQKKAHWQNNPHAFVDGSATGGCMTCDFGRWEPFHRVEPPKEEPSKMDRALAFIRMVAAHEGEWQGDAQDTLNAIEGRSDACPTCGADPDDRCPCTTEEP